MSKIGATFDIAMSTSTLSKTKAKEFRKLISKKERDITGLFMVEGEKSVTELLRTFQPENIICTSEWISRNRNISDLYLSKILIAEHPVMEIVSSLSSAPEVIGIFKKDPDSEKEPLLKDNILTLLLDDIQDPGNLGTIIRTCDWFGVYDIYASKNTVDVYSPKVVQSTMGSMSRIKVHYVDPENFIKKNSHLNVIGALLDGTPLYQCGKISSGIIIMGNEGRGISERLKKYINLPLTIPPVNPVNHPDSLNVAIATSIILSHLLHGS